MNEQIRRVVLVQNHLAELGGITRFCSLLSAGLRERGYEVEIVALSRAVHSEKGAFDPTVATSVLVPGLAPHETRSRITGRKIRHRRLRKALERFESRIRARAAEKFSEYGAETAVVFTQLYARERIGPVVEASARRDRFHLISQYHNSFVGGEHVRDVGRVLEAFAEADLFLSLTEDDATLFRRAGMNNTGFIVNPMRELPLPDYPSESRTVVSLGRYDDQKSLDHLIRAWSLLGEKTSGWTLDLYGDGPERESLQKLIDDRGLAGRVRLMGSTNQALEVLATSAFSVQSSQYEGLPLALMESSALGIPCVAYNCAPGVELIVRDRVTGYLVGPNDEYGLANRVGLMLDSCELRRSMGVAAREHVRAEFSMDSVLDRWEEEFSRLTL